MQQANNKEFPNVDVTIYVSKTHAGWSICEPGSGDMFGHISKEGLQQMRLSEVDLKVVFGSAQPYEMEVSITLEYWKAWNAHLPGKGYVQGQCALPLDELLKGSGCVVSSVTELLQAELNVDKDDAVNWRSKLGMAGDGSADGAGTEVTKGPLLLTGALSPTRDA